MENQYERIKLGERGARISIIAYVFLSLSKLTVGFLSG